MHPIRLSQRHILLSFIATVGLTLALTLVLAVPGALMAQEEWKAPADYNSYPNPIKATDDSIAKGKAVYLKNCALCHGETGDGKGPSAASMPVKPAAFNDKKVQAQSDGSFAFKILSGRGSMPAWAPVLQEDDVWHAINYIRQIGK